MKRHNSILHQNPNVCCVSVIHYIRRRSSQRNIVWGNDGMEECGKYALTLAEHSTKGHALQMRSAHVYYVSEMEPRR